MRLVIVESPYKGDVETNVRYARDAMMDSLARSEAPLVSHLLYTQVLNDADPEDRRVGIDAGHAWLGYADLMAVYMDLGISDGMKQGITLAKVVGIPVEYRWLKREAQNADNQHE